MMILVTVLDVPYGLLKKMIPSADDLPYLAHVRQTEDAMGKPGEDELAIIIGNRLPKPGSNSIAHLVSMEERYKKRTASLFLTFRRLKRCDLIRLS